MKGKVQAEEKCHERAFYNGLDVHGRHGGEVCCKQRRAITAIVACSSAGAAKGMSGQPKACIQNKGTVQQPGAAKQTVEKRIALWEGRKLALFKEQVVRKSRGILMARMKCNERSNMQGAVLRVLLDAGLRPWVVPAFSLL
jgi:hypothetical protein